VTTATACGRSTSGDIGDEAQAALGHAAGVVRETTERIGAARVAR
jgi:hypothetical protein